MGTAAQHVSHFKAHIARLSAKGENAQIARDVLLDSIDCSGIHLEQMVQLLQELVKTPSQILRKHLCFRSAPPCNSIFPSEDNLRRCLTICAPIPSVTPQLKQLVERIVNSKVIDRPKLFIKASDLVDGVSQMSLSEQIKVKDTDVVTKGLLLHRGQEMCCVRCGGKSELGGDGKVAGHVSIRWRAWERMWATRCVCGGAWTRSTTA